MADENKDYEVGYGKPPKHGQFKKGESGRKRAKNPKKRFRSREDTVAAVRDEMITIQVNGKSVRVTAFEASLYKVRSKVLQTGSVRDLSHWIDLMEKHGGTPPDLRQEEAEFHANNAMAKIAKFFERSITPDSLALEEIQKAEIETVRKCAHCMAALNAIWRVNDSMPDAEGRMTLVRRYLDPNC